MMIAKAQVAVRVLAELMTAFESGVTTVSLVTPDRLTTT
jgi:hypothetical protein